MINRPNLRPREETEKTILSCVTRKPVFGFFDQVRHKPDCATTEGSYIYIEAVAKTKALDTCAADLLVFAFAKFRFSHDAALLFNVISNVKR